MSNNGTNEQDEQQYANFRRLFDTFNRTIVAVEQLISL